MAVPAFRTFCTLLQQFIQFGIVGAIGFTVDWCSVEILRHTFPLTIAILLAYGIAASSTWILNRLWTFRKTDRSSCAAHQQWIRFLCANLPGFIINRGVVLFVFYIVPLTTHYPILALLCGTFSSMFINFTCCRTLVFNSHKRHLSSPDTHMNEF